MLLNCCTDFLSNLLNTDYEHIWPSYEVLEAATRSILRLQYLYNLDASQVHFFGDDNFSRGYS